MISEQGYDNLFKQIYSWVFMGNEVMSAGRLLKQANQLKRMGRLDEAIAFYHEAIEINSHFAWTYYDLGDALVKKGNLDEAIACYSQGHFDYDRYTQIQEAGNERKLDQVWAKKENIEFLSAYLQDKLGTISNGICHGTRRGLEQTWFREFLGADVIGTEISKTASQFPYTIQWDFHNVNPDWKDFFDFIYTNAFDHSYDPEKCLNVWIDCLKNDGMCIIEHSKYHGVSSTSELDPFGAEASVMPMLVNLWGQGKYAVSDVLNSPLDDGLKTVFFVIKKIKAT